MVVLWFTEWSFESCRISVRERRQSWSSKQWRRDSSFDCFSSMSFLLLLLHNLRSFTCFVVFSSVTWKLSNFCSRKAPTLIKRTSTTPLLCWSLLKYEFNLCIVWLTDCNLLFSDGPFGCRPISSREMRWSWSSRQWRQNSSFDCCRSTYFLFFFFFSVLFTTLINESVRPFGDCRIAACQRR